MLRGIARDGLEPALRAHLAAGKPMLGTCAGAILLSLGALDISVCRNAYGTQLDSFVCTAEVDDAGLRARGPRVRADPRAAHHAGRAPASRCTRA